MFPPIPSRRRGNSRRWLFSAAHDRGLHQLGVVKKLVLLGRSVADVAQQVDLGAFQLPVDEVVHAADGAQHAVKLAAGHAEARQVDALHGDAALLEIALGFFRVEALAFSENLNDAHG